MRYPLVVMMLLLSLPNTAVAQVSIEIGLPIVSIRFAQPEYPQLVAVPGYPVYYDPAASANYFFYDGLYWVYEGDTWYASTWYNGPWSLVAPQAVPFFILRIPVRYYRQPPAYFRGWGQDAPPRWGEHWGRDWEQHRSGWDRWDHREAPPPAPLPVYQRQYSGSRYPPPEQQQVLRTQNYRHEPRDEAVTKVYQVQAQHAAQAPAHAAPAAKPPAQAQPARPQDREQQPRAKEAPPKPEARQQPQQQPKAKEAPPKPEARQQQPQQGPQGKKGAPPESKGEDGKPKGEERGRERDH